jgi:hypothetical protein
VNWLQDMSLHKIVQKMPAMIEKEVELKERNENGRSHCKILRYLGRNSNLASRNSTLSDWLQLCRVMLAKIITSDLPLGRFIKVIFSSNFQTNISCMEENIQ